MDPSLVATEVPRNVVERRMFPRYRYSAPIVIRAANVPEIQGMTLEISECGTSVMAGASLNVGDTVEMKPVGGGTATAVVRRTFRRLYGFEFLNLSPEQTERINEMCKMLPLYRSRILDVWK